MKGKYIKTVFILLIIVLLSVSCSDKKVEPVIVEEIPSEISTQPENQENEVLETTETPEPTVIEEEIENREPTKSEASLFNTLIGGFFYNDYLDNEYNVLRNEAVNIFNNQIIEVAEGSTELYFSGISLYEEKVLSFIDEVNNFSRDYDENFQVIVDNMLLYNTVIDGLSLQINGYFEIIEGYEKNNINKAAIDGEIFEKTMTLHQKTSEYILFLINTSEYIANQVVENSNIEYADSIRKDTHEIFETYVVPEMLKVERSYIIMGSMYAHIASSDYYYKKKMEDEVWTKLNALEATENTEALKTLFVKNKEYRPEYLIEAPGTALETNSKTGLFSWPFGSVSYASDIKTNSKAIAILKMMEELEFKVSSGSELNDDDISDAIMNMIINQKIKKDIAAKESSQAPNTQALDNMISSSKGTSFPAYADNIPELQDIKIDTNAINKNVKSLEKEIISKELREEIIQKIKKSQSSDNAVLGNLFVNLAPSLGGDTVYNGIINKFADVLKENKGLMKPETYENLSQILNNDLAEVLGSKKSAFVTKFLNGSANDMVNKFTDWVNGSQNSKNIKINRNNLIQMLNAIGFETEAVVEEIETEVMINETKTSNVNSRIYIPKATPEGIIDLTGNDSLDSIMSKVFGKAVLDVPPREQYDNDDKITRRSYEVVEGDNEHITMVYANYKPDGSIAYASTTEIFNRPEGGLRYEVTVRFDKDTKAIKEYDCRIYDKNAAGTIHGYWALYKNGVLVRKLHGDMGKINERGYDYYDSGIKQKEYEFTYKEDAKLIQIKEYYEAGNMRSDIHYKMPIDGSYIPDSNDSDGYSLLYYPNGILGYEGQYLNGNRIGIHVSYVQETGAKDYETHYDNEGNKTKFIVFNNVSGEIESVEEFGQ